MFAGCGDSGHTPCSYRAQLLRWCDPGQIRQPGAAGIMPLRTAASSACFMRAFRRHPGALAPTGFAVALAVVPPFDEVAAFGVDFVLPADRHLIATNPALAVEKGAERAAICRLNFDLS